VISQFLFAGRLRGLFCDSAACAPARRIGIGIWQTDYWKKAVVHLRLADSKVAVTRS
jgi:hypothetical protein